MPFFSKKRKSSLLTKKFGSYLKYAFGEITIIVIGIMFAVQINNWNEESQNKEKERTLLIKLKKEFEANQENLLASVGNLNNVHTHLSSLLKLMGPKPEKVEDKLIHDAIAAYYWNPGYHPNKVIFDMSQLNGEFNLVNNTQLQEKLLEWAAIIRTIEGMQGSIISHQNITAGKWVEVHSWKSSIASTGEMEGVGPSNFPFIQSDFLSARAIEHGVAMKLTLIHMHIQLLESTSLLQKELIDMLGQDINAREG